MPSTSGHPDHVRELELLWGEDDTPSPRTGMTVGRVVAEAIALADEAGLPAVSMRRVAERLGVGAMSLYTYVPGKDELVSLMVDRVVAELPLDALAGASWRERLETRARERWALYHRHPWMVDLPVRRPVIGPAISDRYELELAAVDGLGLDEIEMDAAVEVVNGHVASTARRTFEARRDAERSGISDDEWWYAVLPVLERVMAGCSYPVSERVGTAIGAPHSDPGRVFEFGLARILDGIAALVAERSSAAG